MMGMNPRQMKGMMKKMGIKQIEIPAVRVIIQTEDKEIVFEQPQVSKINVAGQETFQLVGPYIERSIDSTPDINEEDIQTIVDQTGVSEEKAKEALESTKGDLAEAIIELTQ